MLVQGVNLKVTSERIDRSTIAETDNLYSHAPPKAQEEAAHRFGVAWNSVKGLEKLMNGKLQDS